jgi:hypothetical protein
MLATVVDQPLKLLPMNRREAEAITKDIKNNFDSLGAMLMQARDRKAYKALDYSSFEQYCRHEFGKSVSRAYQLIEDCKIRERISAKLSEGLQDDIQISIPSSHLQPLKKLEDVDLQIQAIERAQKIAQAQSTKATKKHLELAVYEVSGQKSEDFRKAIEALGFKKGVEVEAIDKERGFVRRIDKSGKIQVQFHNKGASFIPCNSHQLRILQAHEKPRIVANEFLVKKGDLVTIFSTSLKGKTGKITDYVSPTHIKVEIEGKEFTLPFAELETAIEVSEAKANTTPKDAWEPAIWNDGKAVYVYNQGHISCLSWPKGLVLRPYDEAEFESPMDFLSWWKEKEGGRKETTATEPQKALGISFGKTLKELLSGQKIQTRRAWRDDYAFNFIRYWEEQTEIPALDKQRQYGGQEIGKIRLTEKPYQQLLSEMPQLDLLKEGGMCTTVQEFVDTFFKGEDKLVWVLNFEFMPAQTRRDREQELEQELVTLTTERDSLLIKIAEAEQAIEQMVSGLRGISSNPIKEEPIHESFSWGETGYPDENGNIIGYDDWTEYNSPATIPDVLLDNKAPQCEITETISLATVEMHRQLEITSHIARTKNKIKELSEQLKTVSPDKRKKINRSLEFYNRNLEDLNIFATLSYEQTVIHLSTGKEGKIYDFSFASGNIPHVGVEWVPDDNGQASKTYEQVRCLTYRSAKLISNSF